MSTRFLQIIVIFIIISTTKCKIYDRCELARELLYVHEIPKKYIATWVCLARHESEYNSSAINHGSGDHGLFQISEIFWCSPPGYACGVSCESLRDDDITNDVICAKRIYREHRRLSGDGFNAWVVYGLYCKDTNYVNGLIEGCFDVDGPGDNHIKLVDTPISIEESTTEKTELTVLTSPHSTILDEIDIARSFPPNYQSGSSKNFEDPKKKEFAYTINKTGFSIKQLLKDSNT